MSKPVLNATHRCDACSVARAYVWVVNDDDSDSNGLLFCGNHFAKNELALMASGWSVGVDQRSELAAVAKLDVSA